MACLTAKLLDGRTVATEIRSKLKARIKALADSITVPCLVSILVGEDQASQAYLKNDEAACAQVGVHFGKRILPVATSLPFPVEWVQ